MSRGRTVSLALCLALAAVALAALPSLGRLGLDDRIPVARVERQDFARRIYAEGHLKAAEATPVTAPVDVPGPFKIAWLAPDGGRVHQGEVVVRFDPTEMERNLEDGRSDRATAEQRTAKREVERDSALGNLSRDADLARLELKYAEEFQSKDPEIFSRTEIIESEIDRTLATEREASATGRRAVQEELAGADLSLLGLERRKADLKIQEAETGLRSLEIVAPHDGILVLERDWRGDTAQVGQAVWNGESIAEIPRLDRMEAEVFVLEADAGGLAEGHPAFVTLEARSAEVYEAEVRKVDTLAKRRARWVPVQYFGVTLELPRTDPEVMKPGQRIAATLVLDELQDVLVIPREAVFEGEGGKVVYRRRGGTFEPTPVTLGPSAPGRVVVSSGIEAGDLVALQDPTRRETESAAPGPSPAGGPR